MKATATGLLKPPVIQQPSSAIPSRRARAGPQPALVAALALSALASLAILYSFDPRQYGFYPRCPLYTMTGLHCPGCGALRGLHELLHGHWLAAARMNCLLFPGLPAIGGVYLYQGRRNKDGATFLQSPKFGWCALAGGFLFCVLRNLPVFPFTLLAP